MDHVEWNNTFSQIQRNGVLLNGNVFKENFHDVVNKAFDKEMGFGYISDNGYQPRARVILQGKNPFIDNHTVSNACVLNYFQSDENVAGLAEPCDGRSSSIQPGISSCMGWRHYGGRHYLLYTEVRVGCLSIIIIVKHFSGISFIFLL